MGIINGVDVTSTSTAPWQVSLQKQGSHFCGGSLIASGFVMSACHCRQSRGATAVMGTIYTNQPKISIFGQFTCHPQWNSNMMDYDYSIATLSSEVDVTDPDVAIIPIAAKEYPGGMDAIITGWGMTNPNINRLPTQLQLAETNLVSAEDCKAYWDHAESPIVCNASEETASTADAWEILAVHLSSLTQMMVSPTWLETPPSEPQTAPLPPRECGPRTLLSRTGSTASSLPNFSLSNVFIFICFMNKI